MKKLQAERGERLGGRPPYGYRKKSSDSKEIVPDEETAPIVQRIFQLCASGKGPNQIARILTGEQILTPANYAYQKEGKSHNHVDITRPYDWSGSSVTGILDNRAYLGHTVGLRSTALSYKNKKLIRRPEDEQITVENTHPALVSQELWDIVQDVRQHKKRIPKQMEEPNIFSGLAFCADCGKPMVFHRASTMKRERYNFTCYTYGKRGKNACSPHHIREDELCKIVLDDLQRVTHFARMKERQFAAYINQKNSKELRQEMNALQKELDAMRKRDGELSVLFKRLYEDHVLQRITAEQFRMLSADYNTEQKALQEAIPEKEDRLERLKASAANVEAFIEKAKRFTTIDHLTPELVRLFIQRIEIGERAVKYSRSSAQSVKIIYRDVGNMDSPMEPGERQPHITSLPSIEELVKMLA